MTPDPFELDIARHVWETRYRYRLHGKPQEESLEAGWRRVARALAGIERSDRETWEARFLDLLRGFRFLPGGRILAGAGTSLEVTLFNCFVMGRIEDSMDAIFDGLKEGALTMQQGGGVGYDFSTLRPRGAVAWRVGGVASGPVSFMAIWDAMCNTLLSTAARRGAMMGALRCDHPDILEFIDAKRAPGHLRNFNLSVLVTDAFTAAVRADAEWPLVFPAVAGGAGGERLERRWPGYGWPVRCRIWRRLRARELWARIMRAAYDTAEPGVLFIDRINRLNNLYYREEISATNPCGEIPLPPYGACDLGALNLPCFVRDPFSERTRFDYEALDAAVPVAVRMLDNVIDASRFPLSQQEEQARGSRRIGLALTGLADALIMLGLHYASAEARVVAGRIMAHICHGAYRASIRLAREKGAFPFLETGAYLNAPFVAALPADIADAIRRHGIRNSHLTAIAPTGTISLLANNVSSGIEPVFDFHYRRRVRTEDGIREFEVSDSAWRHWRAHFGDRPLPEVFVDARSLAPEDHLMMQAALQPYVDNAISKTINVPENIPFDAFRAIYEEADALGLKGCTTFRPNPVTGSVLEQEGEEATAKTARCCRVEDVG